MSTSPDCSAVKRCCAVNGTNLTLSGSANTAAAIARQISMLKPLYLPWLSGWPKPGVPGCTPQVKEPACFTLSSVGPAWAGAVSPSAAARPATNTALTHFGIPCPPLCVAAPGYAGRIRQLIAATLAQRPRMRQRGAGSAIRGPTLRPAANFGDVLRDGAFEVRGRRTRARNTARDARNDPRI